MSFFFNFFNYGFGFGSRGGNTFVGSGRRDILFGRSGDDVLYGRGGNDTLFGGRGDDALYGGDGSDWLFGDSGNDFLDGGAGHDHLSGGSGNDRLLWTLSENIGSRADIYSGDHGQDTLVLNLSGAEYTEELRLEILEYIEFISNNTGRRGEASGRMFSFDSINLRARSIENVEVIVDGNVVDPALPPNSDPEANDVAISAAEDDVSVLISADFIDSDIDDVHTFTVDDSGTLGAVTNNGDGTFSYNPNGQFDDLDAGETATDSFSYSVDDGNGGISTATVTVTIDGVTNNTAPVATDMILHGSVSNLNYGPTWRSMISGQIEASDIDGDNLTYSLISSEGPTVYLQSDGQFYYFITDGEMPPTFTYSVSDGNGGEDTGTVTMVNAGFTVQDTVFYVEPGGPTAFLLNTFDGDNDDLYFRITNQNELPDYFLNGISSEGILSLSNNLSEGANQTLHINYTVTDGFGVATEGVITLHVGDVVTMPPPPPPPPDPELSDNAPTAEDGVIAVNGDTLSETGVVTFQLEASDLDGDSLSFEFLNGIDQLGFGGNGRSVVSISDSGLVTVQIVGEIESNQLLSFDYTVSDGTGRSATATISLDIGEAPIFAAPPVANDDIFNVDDNGFAIVYPNGFQESVVFDLLGNDTDVNGDTLSLLNVPGFVTSEAGRSVNIYRDGSGSGVELSGNFASMGGDETDVVTFNYIISDGNGGTDSATATFYIQGINAAPTVNGYYSDEGSSYNTTVNPTIGQISQYYMSISDPDSDGGFTFNLLDAGIDTTITFEQGLYYGHVGYYINVETNNSGFQTITYEVIDEDGGVSVVSLSLDPVQGPPPPPPPPPSGAEILKDDVFLMDGGAPDAEAVYDISDFVSDDDYLIEFKAAEDGNEDLPDVYHLGLSDFEGIDVPDDAQTMVQALFGDALFDGLLYDDAGYFTPPNGLVDMLHVDGDMMLV